MAFEIGKKVRILEPGYRALIVPTAYVYGVDFDKNTRLTVVEGVGPCDCGAPRHHKEDCSSLYQRMEFPDGGAVYLSEKEVSAVD